MAVKDTPSGELTSIILICEHDIRITKQCLGALWRHTQPPWELLVVRATEGTLELPERSGPARVVDLSASDASAGAWQGLQAAEGAYLVLIRDQAVTTDAWLNQLIALAVASPTLGMVGPMSQGSGSPQSITPVTYADLEGMQQFAARWRAEHLGQWLTVSSLSNLCVLLKRDVWKAIGGTATEPEFDVLNEQTLAARVRQAGYELAVARDLYVHRNDPSSRSGTVLVANKATRINRISVAEFTDRFGNPNTGHALCGYTTSTDTHAVLTLLSHARPRRVLEIGTSLGHMTANLTQWTGEDAHIYTIGIVAGMKAAGAAEQASEIPNRADFGRLADHFGKVHKVYFITADSGRYDFSRLAPLDFVFIDGGHHLQQVKSDTARSYAALAPGGWLVWHDFDSPLPWIRVQEAIEELNLRETIYHVEGTQVAFLQKSAARKGGGARREPLRLVWEGDQRGRHSYALTNRGFCLALLERGHELALELGVPSPTPELLPPDPRIESRIGRKLSGGPAQVYVTHRWPPRLEAPKEGRWVFMQPWEFGSLPRAWLPALERADEIWAYSRYVRDCYLAAGVAPDRVHVVPLGVDPEIFRPGQQRAELTPGPEFRFLFVGGTLRRKGIDLLLEAFAIAFSPGDGVGLVVQDMGTHSFYRGQTAGASIAALRDRGYHVEYLEMARDQRSLASLYAACDCLVHPYRGEGFALPVAEAMACGLPVIVTRAGPALDYADDSTAYLVPAQRVESSECRLGDLETVGRPWLWEPNLDALAATLRQVVSDRKVAQSKGRAASARIRNEFTWARAAEIAEARLYELAGRRVASGQRATTPTRAHWSGAPRRPTVSLTMIVRDEEKNLPDCLNSVQGVFDEIVIVDTGSTDRTKEIASSFGARVVDFAWVDDFSAARNAALSYATCDYVFWLDADDRIEPPQRQRLREFIVGISAEGPGAAYAVRCVCDPDSRGSGATVVDHIRLFPNREDVRWEYRVHEQILPSLRRAGIDVRWTDLTVRHVGYQDFEIRQRKLDRDLRLLLAEHRDRPDDPFVLFNLGWIAMERKDPRTALPHLKASLERCSPGDSITKKLYALIAQAHQMLGQTNDALAVCAAGRQIVPDDPELLFREAIVRRLVGDRDGAEACWRLILETDRPNRFSSLAMGISGHITRRNLAVLVEERGDREEAVQLWQLVLKECPGDPDALKALGRLAAAPRITVG